MDKSQIIEKVEKYLNSNRNHVDEVIILLESTIETEKYFIFFFNSILFIETNNYSHALAGNAPIIVSKKTGEIIPSGTAHPINYYIDEYEKKNNS